MTFALEHLTRSRQQELMHQAQQARLVSCLRPPRPWRRRSRRRCA
jgi:hypothetical protein